MGQTCSTPGEKEARDEDEEEEKVLEDDDDFGGCSARWCSSPWDVGKDFLRFEKSSVEEEERRDGRERGTKEGARRTRAVFLPRRKGKKTRGEMKKRAWSGRWFLSSSRKKKEVFAEISMGGG